MHSEPHSSGPTPASSGYRSGWGQWSLYLLHVEPGILVLALPELAWEVAGFVPVFQVSGTLRGSAFFSIWLYPICLPVPKVLMLPILIVLIHLIKTGLMTGTDLNSPFKEPFLLLPPHPLPAHVSALPILQCPVTPCAAPIAFYVIIFLLFIALKRR